jgi:hypothetical protein
MTSARLPPLPPLPANKPLPLNFIRPRQERAVGWLAGLFDPRLTAFLSRRGFACLAVQPPHERRDLFVLAAFVTGPPMACCVDDNTLAM